MRGLVASHEAAMTKLTELLQSQPSYAAHQEDQDAINDQLQMIQQARKSIPEIISLSFP
jgi:hypothetical protein